MRTGKKAVKFVAGAFIAGLTLRLLESQLRVLMILAYSLGFAGVAYLRFRETVEKQF